MALTERAPSHFAKMSKKGVKKAGISKVLLTGAPRPTSQRNELHLGSGATDIEMMPGFPISGSVV